MAYRYCAVAGVGIAIQKYTDGPSYNIAAADHDGVFTTCSNIVMFQHQHDAIGRGRDKCGLPLHHFANIYGVKSVYVFTRVNAIDYLFFIDLFGQGKLYQDTIHIFIAVQFFQCIQQYCFGNIFF